MTAEIEAAYLTPDGLTKLYLEQQDALRAYLGHKYGCPHEKAEDICQDGYVKAIRAIQQGNQIRVGAARVWLWQIVKRSAIDSGRRALLVHFVPLEAIFERPADKDVEWLVETRLRAETALAEMKQRQRVAVLALASGFTYQEIANTNEEGIEAVKMRVMRARREAMKREAR